MSDYTLSTFAATSASLSLTTGGAPVIGGEGHVIHTIAGWYSPPGVRREDTPRLWAHGSFAERGWREARIISVEGSVRCSTRREAALKTDELAAVLADGTAGTFTVSDADLGPRSATVFLQGAPVVAWEGGLDVDFALDLVAPDPRKYGLPVRLTTSPVLEGGGLVFDLFTGENPGVLDFGGGGSTGSVTFDNVGTADTPPTFTVSGYAPGFTITEVETGRRLVYTDSVPSGQSLTLSAADGTVLLNGYADRSSGLVLAEWPTVPGSTRRTYLFESTGTTAEMTLEGVPAWW